MEAVAALEERQAANRPLMACSRCGLSFEAAMGAVGGEEAAHGEGRRARDRAEGARGREAVGRTIGLGHRPFAAT